MPEKVEIPKSKIPKGSEKIRTIDLHVLADATLNGVATTVYIIIEQGSEAQGLITAKSRKRLALLIIEFVAGHMAVNVVDDVKMKSLQGNQKFTCLVR